ncbi:MAG: hypothetical protein KatS3mg094_074 [Candidatus Parcubacteria bacterium]|nr:MAG: hypothetical protein KatS3mg094_074 [Candidatus Parcubacteria bacterium]
MNFYILTFLIKIIPRFKNKKPKKYISQIDINFKVCLCRNDTQGYSVYTNL